LGVDIEIVVDAQRGSGKVSVGKIAAASPEFLTEFVRQTGFSWDGWLLLSGEHDRVTLPAIAEAWHESRDSLHWVDPAARNVVPAEALYTYGDGSSLVWVPDVSLDEAVRLVYPDGAVTEWTEAKTG
jgi:hypothetical protein